MGELEKQINLKSCLHDISLLANNRNCRYMHSYLDQYAFKIYSVAKHSTIQTYLQVFQKIFHILSYVTHSHVVLLQS